MFKKLCLLPLLLLMLAAASCGPGSGEALSVILYPIAVVGVPIQSAIEDSAERQKEWNSYPPPYRVFFTSPSQELPMARYLELGELLRRHSLTQKDYDNGSAKNLLNRLCRISKRVLTEPAGRTAQDNAPFIDVLLDDAEFFLGHPGPDDLNSLLGYAILRGAFITSEYDSYYIYNYYTRTDLSHLAPVRGEQRYRLAELLVRAADKLIVRDQQFTTDMLAIPLWVAGKVSPGESQRADIKSKLDWYLRGCLAREIPCEKFTLDLAFTTFWAEAADEDEKMRLFRQAAAHPRAHLLKRFMLTEIPRVMELLAGFARPENKMEVLSKLGEISSGLNYERFAYIRAIPYYFLVTGKDRRWGEMVPAFMREKADYSGPIPPIVYEMEIAMLEGDIAKGLQLRAQYVLDYVWGYYADCVVRNREQRDQDEAAQSILSCLRDPNSHLLIETPYIAADGQFVSFSWDKPLTYYSGDRETGWHKQSTSNPAQIVEEFYVNIKDCPLAGASGRDRKPTSQERQCVNQVARAMTSGQ